MAPKMPVEEVDRLYRHYAVLELEKLQDWARSTRDHSMQLREQSDVARARAAELELKLNLRPISGHDYHRLHKRLAEAETRAANLAKAQNSNRRIGMAIGILMARFGWTEGQAFDALRTQSSKRNIKLQTLAEHVVYTGGMPPS
jgi:hypothetical protein